VSREETYRKEEERQTREKASEKDEKYEGAKETKRERKTSATTGVGGGPWMHKGWHYSRKDEPGGVTAPFFV